MRHTVRLGITGLVAMAGALLLSVGPADAKMPYFSVGIQPDAPIAGQPVHVTVSFWRDVAHTVPASTGHTSYQGLLVLRSLDGARPDLPILLVRHEPSRELRGTVVIPAAGQWALIAFPDRGGWSLPQVPAGYPDAIPITVLPAAVAGASEHDPSAPVGTISLTAASSAALVGLAVLLRRRGRSRFSEVL